MTKVPATNPSAPQPSTTGQKTPAGSQAEEREQARGYEAGE